MPAQNNPKVVDLFKPKPLSPAIEINRLKAYIRAIDPPIEPHTQTSKNQIFKDGFIPGFVLIQMFQLAKNRKPRMRDRILDFINLGFFGGN